MMILIQMPRGLMTGEMSDEGRVVTDRLNVW